VDEPFVGGTFHGHWVLVTNEMLVVTRFAVSGQIVQIRSTSTPESCLASKK